MFSSFPVVSQTLSAQKQKNCGMRVETKYNFPRHDFGLIRPYCISFFAVRQPPTAALHLFRKRLVVGQPKATAATLSEARCQLIWLHNINCWRGLRPKRQTKNSTSSGSEEMHKTHALSLSAPKSPESSSDCHIEACKQLSSWFAAKIAAPVCFLKRRTLKRCLECHHSVCQASLCG